MNNAQKFCADDILEECARSIAQERILMAGIGSTNPRDRFRAVSKVYAMQPDHLTDYDPYIVDFSRMMTHIEEPVWYSIRSLFLPFYPQYPARGYFLDFADPNKKIAIECDGARWHNAARDAKRDASLHRNGWEIIRIPGWRCLKHEDHPESAHQIIRKLAGDHYGAIHGTR